MQPITRLYLAVGIGSSLGAMARYLSSLGMIALIGSGFPWATLTVNVAGSFVIGLYATLTDPDGRLLVAPAVRQFVLTGFCGGFTTFSVFSLETMRLAAAGRLTLAGANVLLSVVLWLAGVWFGHRLGARLNRLKRGT
jgi:fluoride exporter